MSIAVKANQFSSDTDNETDRLLGTQRNDQLKLSNNHVLADSQHQINEKNKSNTNTREGRYSLHLTSLTLLRLSTQQ